MPIPEPDNPPRLPPFRVELLRLDGENGGRFRPGAVVQITPVLRESGLLRALSGEDVKSLLFVLTFVHPNGWLQPTLPELAHAMRLPEALARQRLQRLQRFRWEGRPLLTELRRENRLDAWIPTRHILAFAQRPESLPVTEPTMKAAGRDAVIAHSRATYARPRAEVEAEIAERNGWNRREQLPTHNELSTPNAPPMNDTSLHEQTPDTPQIAELRQKLLDAGLTPEQAADLLARFPHDAIARQLDWLPYRNANNPTRFLFAAIAGDYALPPILKRRQALEAAIAEHDASAEGHAALDASGAQRIELPLPE